MTPFRILLAAVALVLVTGCPGRVDKDVAKSNKAPDEPGAIAKAPSAVIAAPAKSAYSERLATAREAVEKGRLSEVKALLKEKFDVNDKDDDGTVPLMWAADKGQLSVFCLLLASGAKSAERDAKGRTVLMHAAAGGHPDIVQTLLSPEQAVQAVADLAKLAGAPKLPFAGLAPSAGVSAQDQGGQTALMLAAAGDHPECVHALLGKFRGDLQGGLDYVRLTDRKDQTAAQLASAAGHKKLAAYLEEYARDPDQPDEQGRTALMQAIAAGKTTAALALIQRGVKIHSADKKGQTALMLAVDKGQPDILGALHSRTAQVLASRNYAERIPLYNLADERGRTVLMHAVLADNPAAVKLFVEDGSVSYRPPGFRDYVIALASATDKDGHNALHLGAAHGKANALQALLHAFGDQADYGPVQHIAPPGPQERNTYVARTDKSGKTALKLAEDAGHTQTAAVLKRFGAK